MPVIEDSLWKNPGHPGMIVITSHADLLQDGRLDLNYGEGVEASKRIPSLAEQCGQAVKKAQTDGVYGFLPVRLPRPKDRIVGFGLFQTRLSPSEPANPSLIQHSMQGLRSFLRQHEGTRIRMNFPGIHSGLSAEDVSPLLIPLPPLVTLCHQGEVLRSMPKDFIGFKAIYSQIERMLQEGRMNQAVEYLVTNGFDLQSAMEQVRAVERVLREKAETDARRYAQRRDGMVQTRFNF